MATAPRFAHLRFALDGKAVFLTMAREEGLDLLDWLGLGRGGFGAVASRTLRPLCMRRLWAEPRNLAPFRGVCAVRLRQHASQLAKILEAHPDALVHFG